MTLEQFLEVLPVLEDVDAAEGRKLPIAYHHFKTYQQLPYAIYFDLGSDNFVADNRVYTTQDPIAFELYTEHKDLSLQRQLEKIFSDNAIIWTRLQSVYLSDEKMYQTTYYLN